MRRYTQIHPATAGQARTNADSKKQKIAKGDFLFYIQIIKNVVFFGFMRKARPIQFHIVSLFPDMLNAYLGDSIIGRAIKDKKIKVSILNPRDFSKDKHKKVDFKPYGGGPGMVMTALPILDAVTKITKKALPASGGSKVIIFSPSGKKFTNTYAKNLIKKYDNIILISGRYEGIDARVKKILKAEEVSIGDYVLTGGELPALLGLYASARQIEGVLGNTESKEDVRSASSEVYTRPEKLVYNGKNHKVPKVLLSGHHKDIEEWRRGKSKNDFLKS